jgi:hypothetical protein
MWERGLNSAEFFEGGNEPSDFHNHGESLSQLCHLSCTMELVFNYSRWYSHFPFTLPSTFVFIRHGIRHNNVLRTAHFLKTCLSVQRIWNKLQTNIHDITDPSPYCTEFRYKNHVEVLWVVTPCSVVVGYQRFGGPCCFCLHNITRHLKPEDLDLKHHRRENLKNPLHEVRHKEYHIYLRPERRRALHCLVVVGPSGRYS